MRTLSRRVRKLEERISPQEDPERRRLVELIRERRRRRLQESGQPFEEEHCVVDAGARSIAEVLRSARRRHQSAAAMSRPSEQGQT